jgi:hypothetical protein
MKSHYALTLIIAAALGCSPRLHAQYGNTSLGLGNTNGGNYALASGGFNTIFGGYGNQALGWGLTIGTGSFNLLTGLQNTAGGSFNIVGGLGNAASGSQNLVFGSFLSDGGLPGSVMLSDGNAFGLRTAGFPFTNFTPHTFNGSFNGGYFLFTDDGQGPTANDFGGLFIAPTPANTGVLANNATVGINALPALSTLHVFKKLSAGQDSLFRIGTSGTLNGLEVRTFFGGGPINLELYEGNAFKPGGGSWGVVSDERLKKDIQPLKSALNRLMELRPVTYEYKEPEKMHQLPGTQIGLVAQEVETVFPDWVAVNADGYKTVNIRGFEALAVQALRELREEKDAEIASLKKQLAEQAAREKAIEARLARLEQAAPARAVPVKVALKK